MTVDVGLEGGVLILWRESGLMAAAIITIAHGRGREAESIAGGGNDSPWERAAQGLEQKEGRARA